MPPPPPPLSSLPPPTTPFIHSSSLLICYHHFSQLEKDGYNPQITELGKGLKTLKDELKVMEEERAKEVGRIAEMKEKEAGWEPSEDHTVATRNYEVRRCCIEYCCIGDCCIEDCCIGDSRALVWCRLWKSFIERRGSRS